MYAYLSVHIFRIKQYSFKVEKIAMWYSVLGEVDLNDQYDIECTIVLLFINIR